MEHLKQQEFVRYMGQDDDIARALQQGYEQGLEKGREFEAGYLLRQVEDLLDSVKKTRFTGDNSAEIIHTMTAIERVQETLRLRLIDLKVRNGNA